MNATMNVLFKKLPVDLCVEVYSYVSPIYKLINWVSENRDKLEITGLCQSPKAIDYISDLFEKEQIHWSFWKYILRNTSPKVLRFIEEKKKNVSEFDTEELRELCLNPSLIELVEKKIEISENNLEIGDDNDEVLIWNQLSKNPSSTAVELIRRDMEGKYAFSQLRWHCDCEDADDEIGCICEGFDCWSALCTNTNPDAIALLEKNLDRLQENCLEKLSSNPAAISILEKKLDFMDEWCWGEMSSNPAAVHILQENLDKVDWYILSGNPAATTILQNNIDKVNWSVLSANPAAISILEENRDKIDWNRISQNENAVHLIEEWINNGGEPDWALLSMNPNAIKILEKNKDKIVWEKLSLNPSIFELDRKRMVEEMDRREW